MATATIDSERLVSILGDLIAIPSYEDQARVRRYVTGRLKATGLEPHVDAAGNVVCSLGSGARSLLLNAHMDTVPPGSGWFTEPLRPVKKKGCIYGLGSSDCKGNVAALLEIARCFVGRRLDGKLYLTFTAREELGGNSSRELARRIKADAAIACEGGFSVGRRVVQVFHGCRGTSNFWLTFRGKASHSGSAAKGVNAVTMCSDFIQRAKKTGFGGRSELIPLLVRGGREANVVPDACELYVNYRMDPGETENRARAAIRALATGFDCRIRETECLRGYEGTPGSAIMAAAKRSIARLGYKPETKICGGTLDSRVFQLQGKMDSISVGVGSPHQAHRPNESIALRGLYDGTRMLAGIVEDFLGK